MFDIKVQLNGRKKLCLFFNILTIQSIIGYFFHLFVELFHRPPLREWPLFGDEGGWLGSRFFFSWRNLRNSGVWLAGHVKEGEGAKGR